MSFENQAVAPQRAGSLTVGLCCLVAVLEGFDLQAAGVSAPRLSQSLGLTSAQLGWFFSSSTFGLMVGAAIGGRLSDRYGRKIALLLSVLMFGLLSIVTGLAGNDQQLLAARFLTGVGLGGALPISSPWWQKTCRSIGGAGRLDCSMPACRSAEPSPA